MAPKRSSRVFGAVVVLLIIAIIGRVGYAKYLELQQARVARPVVEDLLAIRTAAFQVATVSGWPADAALGVVPPELVDALDGRTFQREGVQYEWDLLQVDSAGSLVPVPLISARTDNPIVLAAIQRRLRNEAHFVTATGVSVVVSGTTALIAAATPPPPRRRR